MIAYSRFLLFHLCFPQVVSRFAPLLERMSGMRVMCGMGRPQSPFGRCKRSVVSKLGVYALWVGGLPQRTCMAAWRPSPGGARRERGDDLGLCFRRTHRMRLREIRGPPKDEVHEDVRHHGGRRRGRDGVAGLMAHRGTHDYGGGHPRKVHGGQRPGEGPLGQEPVEGQDER